MLGVLRTVKTVSVSTGARTQAYMARELFKPTERPTTAVDMYSFGILAWCVYSGGMRSGAHTSLHLHHSCMSFRHVLILLRACQRASRITCVPATCIYSQQHNIKAVVCFNFALHYFRFLKLTPLKASAACRAHFLPCLQVATLFMTGK